MTYKPCFGKLHDGRVRECQECSDASECCEQTGILKETIPEQESEVLVRVQQVLNQRHGCSAKQLQKDLLQFFGKKVSVFYYLNYLRRRGLIEMKLVGRQRLYYLL